MLRGLRNASSNWLGKTIMTIVMGVLIISFAVWGIADIFRGFGRSTLATIGKTDISIESFREAYNDRLRQFGNQLGRPLTSDQARALGIDRQILRQSIAEAVLDESVRKQGLGLSDAGLRTAIMNDPAFRGINGQFDANRFGALIRQAGYSEQRFVAAQRAQSLRRQIAASVNAGLTPPAVQVDAFVHYQSEERAIEFLRLKPENAGAVSLPNEAALQAYFDANKARFRAPEYRTVAVLILTPQTLAKPGEISDEEARKAFEQSKSKFEKPEKCHLLQLVFPDEAKAKAAGDKIAAGTDFAALAAELGKKTEDIDLGTIAKADMIDPSVADAAFALGDGAVSAPVKGRFGWVLLKTQSIEPGLTPSYESVADAIKADLASARARTEVSEMYNKIEDERAGGANVAEAAKKLGLALTTIKAVDRSGRGPDDKPVAGLPAGTNIVAQSFTSDVGVENDPIQYQGGYVWYDVIGVTPARERNFDEVRARVETRWRDEDIAKRLKAKADELVAALNAGKPFAEVAQSVPASVESASGLTREGKDQTVSADARAAIFAAADGKAGQAAGKNEGTRIVFRLTKVAVPADAGKATAKKVTDALVTPLADELVAQYVVALESEIGVKINETAFQQATGATSN